MRRLLVLAVFTTLTSSALARMPWSDKPAWSEVDGEAAANATDGTVGLTVLSIDKKSLSNPKEKITLDPGKHALLLAGTRASSEGTVAVAYRFEAAPCVRYKLGGRHPSPGDSRLEIVVLAQETIAGCNLPPGAAAVTTSAPAPAVAAPAPAPASNDEPAAYHVVATPAPVTEPATAEAAAPVAADTAAPAASDGAGVPLR